MSTETTATPLEVVSDEQPELAVIVRQNALPDEAAKNLQSSFAPAFTEARNILQQSRQIVVTDVGQKLQIKLAREYRLALKNVRVGADKVRKELKDESVRKGRAIDGFFNILLHITESEETRLEEQEKFAEVQEAKRKAALKAKREEFVTALGIDPNLYQLGEMSEETFQTLVEGTKLARAAQEAARVKAEADRIAKEAADAAERERIRVENERLKKEAEEREAAAKIERERIAKEKAEAEEALRLERERVEKEKAAAAAVALAEIQRREAMAAEEKRKADEAAAEIRRVAEENARIAREKAEAELAEQKRIADEKAATERAGFERKQKEIQEANRQEQLRLQALREVERQKEEAQRKEDEARLIAERQAREKAEMELKVQKAEADRKAKADALAAKKAAAAPDRQKLVAYWDGIDRVARPAMTTEEGKTIMAEMEKRMSGLASWLEWEAAKL